MNFVGMDQDAVVIEMSIRAVHRLRGTCRETFAVWEAWQALANWRLMYIEESRDARERARLRECASS